MPRIRSIKPEYWTSGQVLECSPTTRLLFIGLWNFSDDCGRHPYRPKQIKAEIFPGDDLKPDDILEMLQELSENDLIMPYEADGNWYLQVTGWHHQRIDRPQPAKHPAPVDDNSSNDHRSISLDTKGRDEKGRDVGQSNLPERFREFWNAYPKKVKKQDARKKWKASNLDSMADEIIGDVEKRKKSDGRWLDGYVPDPTTYIDGKRWQDALEPIGPRRSNRPDWARLPTADDKLWQWAKKHDYPNPGSLSYLQYRRLLTQAVEERLLHQENKQVSH